MKHVLVVEDEEHLALGIKYNLEAEGYSVTTVADGTAALRLIETDPCAVDLVVLDVMLPGMSGYRVCQQLREAGNSVPVLILSARTLAEDRIRGFEVGADQYLMKPFDLDELLSRVKNLLSRRVVPEAQASESGGSDEEFQFDDVHVNFATYDVSVRGEPVRLTSTEMKLLRYFVTNEGRVISRDELLEHVWGFANSPTTRTVDNFVLRLRKYFEKDPANPQYLLSVRGAGYRFVSGGETS